MASIRKHVSTGDLPRSGGAARTGARAPLFRIGRCACVAAGSVVTLNEWPIVNGDWNADGSGLLIPSITRTGTPVILEVNRAGKASVVLEGAANTPFESMIQAPDGHHGILVEIVPGDNNAWMIDNF
jgi:hypothetical protein